MSKLIGLSTDVYNVYKRLNDEKIVHYKKDLHNTTWENVIDVEKDIEMYIPENAKERLKESKITIVKAPLKRNTIVSIPTEEGDVPTIYFPSFNAKEEYKKELVYYFGMLLREENKDKEADFYNIPSMYQDVLPLLLEYAYLDNMNFNQVFSIQKLHELYISSRDYIKAYNDNKKIEEINYNSKYLTREQYEKVYNNYKKYLETFENVTLDYLIPLASLDATLQITDNKDKYDLKEVINKLYENKDNDRTKIIRDLGIDTYRFNRLNKEIDKYKVKSLKK